MNKKVYLTRHSKIRGEQRLAGGVSADKAAKAFKKGKEFSSFKGELSEYIRQKCSDNGRYVAKVYDDALYIFENRLGCRLLTVYKLPEELLPIEKYLIENDELEPKCIMLTDKLTGKIAYLTEFGEITEDICEAVEFKNQKKAANYLANNRRLQELRAQYEIGLF